MHGCMSPVLAEKLFHSTTGLRTFTELVMFKYSSLYLQLLGASPPHPHGDDPAKTLLVHLQLKRTHLMPSNLTFLNVCGTYK